MLTFIDSLLHEYPGHKFDDVFRGPAARWFALCDAIEERHGAESGNTFVNRQIQRAIRETDEWLLENFVIVP